MLERKVTKALEEGGVFGSVSGRFGGDERGRKGKDDADV